MALRPLQSLEQTPDDDDFPGRFALLFGFPAALFRQRLLKLGVPPALLSEHAKRVGLGPLLLGNASLMLGNAYSRLGRLEAAAMEFERCAAIAFVERPFMGKSSAFIAFINLDGGIMFKVFVGRDETRTLRADQLQRFHALAERIASARAV